MELRLDNITCGYNNKKIINNLSCTFKQGEAVAVIGPNGVGKSTILKNILQQYELFDGRITIGDKDLNSISLKEYAACIAYIPQIVDYRFRYKVVEIIMMGRAAYLSRFAKPGQKEYDMAMSVLRRLDMEDYAERNYSMLSGGEQQMVLLARAIVQNSRFILMDEPTSNLDYYNQKTLINCINELKRKNVGIVIISHSLEHVFTCCDKVLMLKKDGSHLFGTTDEILTETNIKDTFGTDVVLLKGESENGRAHRAIVMDI